MNKIKISKPDFLGMLKKDGVRHNDKIRLLKDFMRDSQCDIKYLDQICPILLSLYSVRNDEEKFKKLLDEYDYYIYILLSVERWFGSGFENVTTDGKIDMFLLLNKNIPAIIELLKPIVYEYLQLFIKQNNLGDFLQLLGSLPYENKKAVMGYIIDKKPEWNVYLIESIAASADRPGLEL